MVFPHGNHYFTTTPIPKLPPTPIIPTGAGISAESSLATFRGQGNMWSKHLIADVATPKAFLRNPDLVNQFYNERRHEAIKATPSLSHQALALLSNISLRQKTSPLKRCNRFLYWYFNPNLPSS
ncbi:Sir2 family NAD-dependent protein deacetylase [Bartonella sp. DGB2]|uniref:Sir2 family NAD-dependent protein deacetylase n=1 Tax=Bartonella sp. DGB2 TaxID=3388426 RepID=UPI0039903833